MTPDSDLPPVTFALGMASVHGSPPFTVLVFDDGAAVALHSVQPLAAALGLHLPQTTLFELLQDWGTALPALVELAQVLAYDDRARGHRGQFVPRDLFTAEMLVPETRQMFCLRENGAVSLPVTTQGGATSSLLLDERGQKLRPAFALAAIVGAMCRNGDPDTARAAIAGWTLAAEFVQPETDALGAHSLPGTLVLGPVMVPAAFAGNLDGIGYALALMARVVESGDLGALAAPFAERISRLSTDVLLLPGDVVVAGAGPAKGAPEAGAIDVLEATAAGFGRINVSLS